MQFKIQYAFRNRSYLHAYNIILYLCLICYSEYPFNIAYSRESIIELVMCKHISACALGNNFLLLCVKNVDHWRNFLISSLTDQNNVILIF